MTKNEKLISSIITIITVLLVYGLSYIFNFKINYIKFSELFINAFSIIVGFLLTVGTLLHSINNEKIEFIRKSGKESNLYLELKEAIYFGLIAVLSSIIFSLFENIKDEIDYVGCIILFVNFIAFFRCYYFIKFFFKMMIK